jgi:hypothetical protein
MQDVHRNHHRRGAHRRRPRPGQLFTARQAPDHRGARPATWTTSGWGQHRAQRRLHDGHPFDPAHAPFTIDISAESLDKTAGLDQPGPVNLEKALRAHDRLGGHIVSGHVDGIGTVTHFAQVGESWELRVLASPHAGKYLAYKGSITVNGVSLTVNRIADRPARWHRGISINLIPHTVQNTALGQLATGSRSTWRST